MFEILVALEHLTFDILSSSIVFLSLILESKNVRVKLNLGLSPNVPDGPSHCWCISLTIESNSAASCYSQNNWDIIKHNSGDYNFKSIHSDVAVA